MLPVLSVALLGVMITLSLTAAVIVQHPWQRWFALGCAAVQFGSLSLVLYAAGFGH